MRVGESVGPYTLIEKLGKGSFGQVWLAERRTAIATTQVALKTPVDDDVNIDAIRQEASVWAQASGHPNVLPIIEANIYDGQVVIVSEYAPDGSLVEWLNRQGGAAPVGAAVEIMSGILSGLEHLHSRRIIHRDLKPANILLQGKTPRLADFGIARMLKTTSQSGVIAGTPAYMAPEAFDGKRTEQTDLWSAGVIFYQLLSGRLPFPQTDLTSLMGAIVTRNPDPPPAQAPPALHDFLSRALQKDPAWRFASAAQMRAALEEAVGSVSFKSSQMTNRFAAGAPGGFSDAATVPAVPPTNAAAAAPRTGPATAEQPPPGTLPIPPTSSTAQTAAPNRLPWILAGVLATLVMGGTLAGALYVYFTGVKQKREPTPTPVVVQNTPPATEPKAASGAPSEKTTTDAAPEKPTADAPAINADVPKAEPLPPGSEGHYVIGYSSPRARDAETEARRQNQQGYKTTVVNSSEWSNLAAGYYIVVYGIYPNEAEAAAAAREIGATGRSVYVKKSGKRVAPPVADPASNDTPGRFPEASLRALTRDELLEYSKDDLKIMRNEIFARHGYVFKDPELRAYFNKQSWYVGQYDDVSGFLSPVERQNVEVIKQLEK
jgi:serine/threonine-protein kinase